MSKEQILYVKVLEAKGLPSADSNGFSDPYVKLCLNNNEKTAQKTKTIKRTLNPLWAEKFEFANAEGTLNITVKDWNALGRGSVLGTADVALSDFKDGKPAQKWLSLQNKEAKAGSSSSSSPHGELHIILQLIPKGVAPTIDSIAGKDLREVREGKAQLVICVLDGKGLAAKDITGTSDPYCVLEVDKVELGRTNIIEKTLDPLWGVEFMFEIEANSQLLCVSVWDWDLIGSDDSMGVVKIPLKTLEDGRLLNDSFKLEPQKKEKVSGSIRLMLQLTSPEQARVSFQLTKKYFDELVAIVTDPDLSLTYSMLQLYESNDLARAVMNVFNAQNKVPLLFEHVISKEVKATKQDTTLFRTDSVATRTMISYLKYTSNKYGYMEKTIVPIIHEVLANPKGCELDPEKMPKTEKHEENVKTVLKWCERFLAAILNSKCPAEMHFLLSTVRDTVAHTFPSSQIKAVGGIFFLRFVGPAIFAPEGFGLIKSPPSPEGRRALTFVAKILQNAANGVAFGSKEQFMEPFNPFIASAIPKIDAFFDSISRPAGVLPLSTYTEDQKVQDLSVVVKNLQNNLPKLEQKVARDHASSPALLETANIQISILKKLFNVGRSSVIFS
eukprot:TRINITY_DN7719_c0_g1_i1.p1 TRINITY_DN7719_c0_g1~~TRINITY_DN7719_c0_g1_i1.p1  ORF type:complete len:647 (+),score=138.87 TRINITY_DN7719_c0_g1_i1:103-1941(+)